jgi:hypothetical protein
MRTMKNDPRNRPPVNAKGHPTSWDVNKSEVKALLSEENWTPDPDFTGIGCAGYVSERGELLLIYSSGSGALYASRKEVVEKWEENKRRGSPNSHHVLEGLLPQGPHFIEAVPSLIDELAQHLKLPRESLDGSYDSLRLVDAALKKVRPRKRILETPNFFAGIVAYTGEVLRRESGGIWKLNEVAGGIHEPYVHFGEDYRRYINPFLEPYKAIAEQQRGGLSLAAIVAGLLMAKGLGDRFG